MSTDRPEPGYQAPEGYEFVAEVNPGWRLVTGKLCRRPAAAHQDRARPAAIAELDRSWSGSVRRNNWWAYCADHMYGNWIKDGQVMHWILRKTDGES